MENSFNIINTTASSCGSCHTTGCGTCAPAPPKVERTTWSAGGIWGAPLWLSPLVQFWLAAPASNANR